MQLVQRNYKALETKASCFICIKCHWSPINAASQPNYSDSNNLLLVTVSPEMYSQKPINEKKC